MIGRSRETSMADVTKEFFDRPENDDTLQNIRKQYLESKRNLQDLMLKQNSSSDKDRDQSPRVRRGGFKSPLKPKEIATENGIENMMPNSENMIMVNELRSLRSLVYEQEAQIRRLQSGLQSQQNSEFEFRRVILQLQSQLKNVRDELVELKHLKKSGIYDDQDYYAHDEMAAPPVFDDSTAKLIQISGQRR